MAKPWDEQSMITVLNILLEMRMDPEPPGARLAFHFYSAHEVPEVLRLLFADSMVSEFECRSSLVARFGNDLEPEHCQQLAAVAMSLVRECFSITTAFGDPQGEGRIEAVVAQLQKKEGGLDAEPLNSLIVLGCLYGELLRARLPYPSRWARVKHYRPWPALIFSAPPRGPKAGEGASSPPPDVAFNPIAHLIHLFKNGERSFLQETSAKQAAKCSELLSVAAGRGA
jgi:hypothetical protein